MNISLFTPEDMQIRNEVEAELVWSPQIADASTIAVAVHDGVVALTGTVPTYTQRIAAALAALDVRGVTAIANDIEVVHGARHDDAAIAERARDALDNNVRVPHGTVDVQVTHGVVTLTGTVDWQFQRTAAYRTVESIPGIKDVIEDIKLRPRVSSSEAHKTIRSALERLAHVDAEHIVVDVDGTTVTLRGTVSSYVEKQAAERAAWSSPHVIAVKNELRIVTA